MLPAHSSVSHLPATVTSEQHQPDQPALDRSDSPGPGITMGTVGVSSGVRGV